MRSLGVIGTLALDLLREARARKWVWALALAVTAALLTVAFALRLDVVDGALAASRFFGDSIGRGVYQPVEVFLRPLFEASAYVVFYGGMIFGIIACADFAPSLLAPGRIEHLLSLPLRRTELLAGTYLGVLLLVSFGALYGSVGLTLILGVKAGVWGLHLILASLLAILAFAAVYALMLASAVFVRSAALSAGAGFLLFVLGIIATYRADIARLFEAGLSRQLFTWLTAPLPRIAGLANLAGAIAAEGPVEQGTLLRLGLGALVFAAAGFALAAWRFGGKDY
ncbi:MAG: hypothetical protein P1V51_12955 [Deltaproteobacteria bacterium]|nr:hypothetical protein [Deltaproteobacteria bacterium]